MLTVKYILFQLHSDLIGRVPGGPTEKHALKKKRRSYSLSRSSSRSSLGTVPLLLPVHTVTYVVTMCTRNAIAIACSYSYIRGHYVYS